MDRSLIVRAGSLYVPICLALLAGRLLRQPPRQFAACLLSFLWVLPSLPALQSINQATRWWSFASDGPEFRGMPVELYLGWALLWGILPQLAMPRLGLWKCAAAMVALDLLAMPRSWPVVALGPRWLVGEAAAVAMVLVPALGIARCTLNGTHLRWRVLGQVVTSAGLFLFSFRRLRSRCVAGMAGSRCWECRVGSGNFGCKSS
jgi:hypothetical protein